MKSCKVSQTVKKCMKVYEGMCKTMLRCEEVYDTVGGCFKVYESVEKWVKVCRTVKQVMIVPSREYVKIQVHKTYQSRCTYYDAWIQNRGVGVHAVNLLEKCIF